MLKGDNQGSFIDENAQNVTNVELKNNDDNDDIGNDVVAKPLLN